MKKGLLIDTNLLLVMIVGGLEEGRYIEKSKRLGDFCVEDYHQLWLLVEAYSDVWITPYIAAEVSNLINLHGQARVRVFELARKIFSLFKQVETWISEDCEGDLFLKFGLTDNSIIRLSESLDIITSDHRMASPLFATNPERVIPYVPFKQLNS